MKLFFVLAVAALLLVATNATFLEGEENPMRSRCRQQMRMMRPQLEQCERYMTMDSSSMDDDDQSMRRSTRGREAGCRSEDECMRGCCKAMREMDEECACEWMKNMVHEQRGEMGEEDMRMMMKKMRQMPSQCGMGSMSCSMGGGRKESDENPMRSGCRQQMRMMRPQLEQCERYMTMDSSSMANDDQFMKRSIRGREAGCRSEDECMRGCCKAMREMDEECACQWMKNMVHEQRGEMGEEDMRMMMKKMRQMPSQCGMGHMSCSMGEGRRGYE